MTIFTHRKTAVLAAMSACALAACSSPEAPEDIATDDMAANVPTTSPGSGPAGAPGGARGAPVLLEAMEPQDQAGVALDGELGCAFYASRGDDPLFVGAGDVGSDGGAEGLVKVDGQPVRLAMDGAGGYDRMADGALFSAGALAAEIDVTGSEPLAEDPPIAGESPIFPARLTVTREGRSIAVDGLYECGP